MTDPTALIKPVATARPLATKVHPHAAPLGKRERLADVFAASGLAQVVGRLRSSMVRDLRVLAYHRVLPDLDEGRHPFDVELVSASVDGFDRQMRQVARDFHPVSVDQVAASLESGRALPRRAVLVTFDDGFDDNHQYAFPVLQRHGIPGLFFLSTGYIGGHDMFWFEQVVHLVLKTTQTSLHLPSLAFTVEPGLDMQSRRQAARLVLDRMKHTSNTDRLRAMAELTDRAEVLIEPGEQRFSATMTWDQVREMAKGGMHFGSHAVTHPVLSNVEDPAQLRHELVASADRLTQELGVAPRALAYPVGGGHAYDDRVVAAARDAGYAMAFAYQAGVNRAGKMDRYRLRRLAVERYTTASMFTCSLLLPEVFVRPYA
ncbi:MAG: polysaccharide deacetylase family protein [Aquabacterium sp.]